MTTYSEYTEAEKQAQLFIANPFYEKMNWIINRDGANYIYDLILKKDDVEYKIEEKFRFKDYHDFLIELIQDVPTYEKGWYYSSGSKFIFYWVCDGIDKLYVVNWDKFKIWINDNWGNVKIDWGISIEGRGKTLFACIKWDIVPNELYKLYKE